MSATFDVNINDFLHYPYYFPSHFITLASLSFCSLVVSYRLSVGPFERLLAFQFFALHLILGVFLGLCGVESITRLFVRPKYITSGSNLCGRWPYTHHPLGYGHYCICQGTLVVGPMLL
jgi:hypothetical protein